MIFTWCGLGGLGVAWRRCYMGRTAVTEPWVLRGGQRWNRDWGIKHIHTPIEQRAKTVCSNRPLCEVIFL